MKRFVLFLVVTVYSSGIISAQSTDSLTYEDLEPYYFHLNYITDSSSVLIDVREFFEYRRTRIRDAVHIPTSGGFEITADTLGKERSLFLYCYNGYRSKKAAEFFISKGFTRAYNLEGGIVQWRRDNMPVEKTRVRRER
jgi:rhodanese-related sulfurtransferase